jgi:hypothetical protein
MLILVSGFSRRRTRRRVNVVRETQRVRRRPGQRKKRKLMRLQRRRRQLEGMF